MSPSSGVLLCAEGTGEVALPSRVGGLGGGGVLLCAEGTGEVALPSRVGGGGVLLRAEGTGEVGPPSSAGSEGAAETTGALARVLSHPHLTLRWMRDEQWPLKEFARHNRSHMSRGEVKLWMFLRRREVGHRLRRQHTIGRYIVDFVCLEKRLIVEVDGSQHGDLENDQVRDDDMRRRGYRVLRFSAWSVLEYTGQVIKEIRAALHGDDLRVGDLDEVLERSRRGY